MPEATASIHGPAVGGYGQKFEHDPQNGVHGKPLSSYASDAMVAHFGPPWHLSGTF